ncbi:hypothetical protein RhiirA1_529937 [Rhizophagus irregularis]|uniref:Uncharacterized protein n=1 Tax=Rhizophagus irregularis TaxID=588596 RepID=A0A2N0SEP4_9GLOM|nr:hypothetical protein RhiirA1_529937 [Rhizophagus irregularis]CAB4473012.1 unnamed protein product [Rhizophagus irregularis]
MGSNFPYHFHEINSGRYLPGRDSERSDFPGINSERSDFPGINSGRYGFPGRNSERNDFPGINTGRYDFPVEHDNPLDILNPLRPIQRVFNDLAEKQKREEQKRERDRMMMIKKKVAVFFDELSNIIKDISKAIYVVISSFRDSKIKIINKGGGGGGGGGNVFCQLLDNIRNVLDDMINHLEKYPSDFTSFKRLGYQLRNYTSELLRHVEDAKSQQEEILKNQKNGITLTIASVLGLTGIAVKEIDKAIVSAKAVKQGVVTALKTLFESHTVGCIIVLAGTIAIGFAMYKLQKHINAHEKLVEALKRLAATLKTMDEQIPNEKEEEKYKIMTSNEGNKEKEVALIKQLKEYKVSIGELKDLISS